MRSVQGHSGGQKILARLQNHVLIPHGWSDQLITWDHRMITSPFVKGVSFHQDLREGRPTCFLPAVDPMVATMLAQGTNAQCSILV